MAQNEALQIRAIGANAHAVTDSRRDYEPLMELLGNSRFTLLGEASHGTHDFYHTRAQVTQWLIKEKGYSAREKRVTEVEFNRKMEIEAKMAEDKLREKQRLEEENMKLAKAPLQTAKPKIKPHGAVRKPPGKRPGRGF